VESAERPDGFPHHFGTGIRLDAAGPSAATVVRFMTAVTFTVAILTDTLDGYLARKHNIITRFGKLADPIADKALTGMAFIGLSIIGELPGGSQSRS
jgi:phosphatidylglycerophosphate synthase